MKKTESEPKYDETADKFITAVLVLSFLIGTATHTADVIQLGFPGYSGIGDISRFCNYFWTSLLFINPIIAFLLIVKRSAGAVAAFIVISADVIINYSFYSSRMITHQVWEVPSFSLQFACFLFSFLTLPKLLCPKSGYYWIRTMIHSGFSKIPLIVLCIGLIIHIQGIATLDLENSSLWSLWVHFSMIVVDSLLLLALIMKLKIGFYGAIVGFGIFGLTQGVFAAGNFLGFDMPFNSIMGATLSISLLVIASLLDSRHELTGSLFKVLQKG